MTLKARPILFSVALLLASLTAFGQSSVRATIDNERAGTRFNDPQALEKARRFIRLDSTYYVGHMFQGMFMFFRANDKLGFTQAIVPLRKAFDLMDEQFTRELKTRTNDYYKYNAVFRYHRDYGTLAYYLDRCYQNVEKQEMAFEVIGRVKEKNFQVEQGLDSYNTLAWIFHRNRVYTSKQFPFLKNSVKENVHLANRYLDSALWKISNDYPVNNGLFDPGYLNRQYLSTFHYKAMLYDYKLDIDSANFYYDALIQNDAYSSNNYAEFKLAMGEFEQADYYFKEAAETEGGGEKHTKEYYYMRGTLETYRANPAQADTLLKKVMDAQGSTPGYGWHSIGLARALHYEGLTQQSQERTNKAARFQELHIGTTWGQEQYNLAVASLNYINQLQFEQEYLFENDQWWFWLNPLNWYRSIRYAMEIHHHKLLLASLVAENPERNEVIYSIFASENLVNFDEVWSVIDGFGNDYFIKVYKQKLATDKRPKVKKYIKYFLGRLYLANGDESEAKKYFNSALKEEQGEFDSMLRARIYEGMAKASSGSEREEWVQRFYSEFPQLVPFSGLTMKFQLDVAGDDVAMADDVLDELKDCSIKFTSDNTAPVVRLTFVPSAGNDLEISYVVSGGNGRIFAQGAMHVEKGESENVGKLLAYRLFAIEKLVHEAKPEPVRKPV